VVDAKSIFELLLGSSDVDALQKEMGKYRFDGDAQNLKCFKAQHSYISAHLEVTWYIFSSPKRTFALTWHGGDNVIR
jgi:hypothetical protein